MNLGLGKSLLAVSGLNDFGRLIRVQPAQHLAQTFAYQRVVVNNKYFQERPFGVFIQSGQGRRSKLDS